MHWSALDLWIDYSRAVNGMRPKQYAWYMLNDFCNINEVDIGDQEQIDMVIQISDLYDCLCLYFQTDDAIAGFMNRGSAYLGGRSPWEFIASDLRRVKKRVDIILQLVDRQYTMLSHHKNGK